MALPIITPNKNVYAPGELMSITVSYGAFPITFSAVAPNGEAASASSYFGVAFTSTPARTWTRVSDTGSSATFTATA